MEIQKADPHARRKALWIILIGTIVGAIGIILLKSQLHLFEQWLGNDSHLALERLKLALAVIAILTAVPLLGLAIYIWRLGTRIIKTQRFPPPGMTVVRDTPVLTGNAARLRARVMQTFAGITALMALALPIVLWQIVRVLERA